MTAVQNIERQFQIPSKISGFLVSARKFDVVDLEGRLVEIKLAKKTVP